MGKLINRIPGSHLLARKELMVSLGPHQQILTELYCFRLVHTSVRGHSKSVILNPISSKFHIWIASIKLSFKFEYWFCLMNDNEDGLQNGSRLCVRCLGHSYSVIFNQISSKIHIWIDSIILSLEFEYGFCQTKVNF